jgi:hypothetical protein
MSLFSRRLSLLPQLLTSPVTRGLVRAWDLTAGITSSAGAISNIDAAWGMSDALTQATGANQPQLAAGLGPNDVDIVSFDSTSGLYFNFTDTGVMTAATAVVVMAPKIAVGHTLGIFGRGASNTSFVTISGAGDLLVRPVGAAVSATIALPVAFNANLQIMVLSYKTDNGGQVTPYIDGIKGTATTGIGTGGFDFARLGAQGMGSTSPFDGYMAAALLYDLTLTDREVADLTNFLSSRRGRTLYVSASGDDSSETPWNKATPLLSPVAAAARKLHGGETIALKGGDVFRLSARILPYNSLPSGRVATLDGKSWGDTSKPAQLRFSLAPTPSLVSGTVYDCGAATAPHAGTDGSGPTNHVHYVPGGAYAFSGEVTGYEITNVVRLTQDTSTPSSPAPGKWGSSGGHIYVNAGVALSAGDIEIPQAPGGFIVAGIYNLNANGWHYRDFDIAFADATGLQNHGSHDVVIDGVRAFFNALDGIDGAQDSNGDGTTSTHVRCVAAWNGSGLTAGSGGPGDGFSFHEDVTGLFFDCAAVMNDKSGFDHLTGTTTVHDRCVAYGNSPFWYNNSSTWAAGSYTVKNSLAYVPAGLDSYIPVAFRHTATASSGTPTITVDGCTAYSFSQAAGYIGISQATGRTIVAKNNIFANFNIGLQAASGGAANWTTAANCLHGNVTDYSGVTPAPTDLLVDPQFASAPADLSISGNSPCKAAGINIGADRDFSAVLRAAAPSIGGFE